MSRYVTVTCPACGHEWQEDLDKATRTIVRGEKKTRTARYILTCPNCGDRVVVEVKLEEEQ